MTDTREVRCTCCENGLDSHLYDPVNCTAGHAFVPAPPAQEARLTREEFAGILRATCDSGGCYLPREDGTNCGPCGACDALLAHDAAQREEIERLAGALERSRDYVSDEALGSESQEYRDASFAVLAEIDAALADSKQRTREWEERASNARNDAARLRKALEEKP